MYFQDPAFDAFDNAFISSLGYLPIKDPQHLSFIDEKTFVFAQHLPNFLKAPLLNKDAGLLSMTDLSMMETFLYDPTPQAARNAHTYGLLFLHSYCKKTY